MDRKTRRANFKNLQPRTTRSTKASTDTLSLSNFFATPEEAGEDPPAPASVPAEPDPPAPKIKPIRTSNVFEKPGPKPKKAPKLKGSSAPSTGGSRRGRGKSKQQPSISNFLRNEQIFAEVTAQHCMADNFSPDDIEMALALSKSEAEKKGLLRLNDEDDAVIDLVDDEGASTEKIRLKLKKYGFRTAAKEDYKSLAVLPVLAGKGGRRGKWANKFTALTLRNPEVQQKKLEEKVSALLAQQVRTKSEYRAMPVYNVISANLQKLRVKSGSQIIREPNEGAIENLSLYYVTDLIEVSQAPADHLLKNWAAIQGRDLSPERETSKTREQREQLELVYEELEKHFGDQQQLDQQVNAELDELEKLVAENMIEDHSKVGANLETETSSASSSPSKEPPDKRPKMTKDEKENIQPAASLASLSIPTKITRCTSPDLFADSDDEPVMATTSISNEPTDLKDFSLKVYKNLSTSERSSPVKEVEMISSNEEPTQISTYEVFSSSSDEVKTVSNATEEKISFEDKSVDDFIDLTQQFEMADFNEPNSKILSLIAPCETDSKVDNLIGDMLLDSASQEESCPISKELYLKYAKVEKFPLLTTEENEDKEEISLKIEEDTQSSQQSSFNLDISTPSNNTKQSSSFSELNFSRNSIRRSVSLSTDHIFKSPLNWKMNLSGEKRVSPARSPYKHSDASFDLTQNSDDENDVILLSDEEINYSIWKANKTTRAEDVEDDSSDSFFASPVSKKRAIPQFQTEDDLDAFLKAFPSDGSHSPNNSALSKERAEFGILDAAPSQPFTLSQLQSPVTKDSPSNIDINWAEASFLDAPVKPLARRSSHKFNDLLAKVSQAENSSDNDFDEFDQIVFQNAKDATIATEADRMPSGLETLLRGKIKTPAMPETSTRKMESSVVPEQVEVDGNVYTVRVCHTPKPDFTTLSESEILQQLYNYGIKPLKRKQAVKMLEFIYNQTHPIMQTAAVQDLPPRNEPMGRSKSTPVMMEKPRSQLIKSTSEVSLTPTEPRKDFKFNDAWGDDLLRFSQSLPPSLCDDFEIFVTQTNISKKTPQPLVPLHIAWHNLLCANPQLHESVLMYEPIDLQEVYLYLKHMGHRYDPKDLKTFFDRRCIIFRYELAAPGKQAERHVRKHPKNPSKRK
ncbi:structure-specific endonuclease subunit SLX4 isoform X1 [Drosophila elegans]|uniref:structure-specific endonuclease subunit SLX4 isoform X1 n=1 Tax=Drosophila elegans TaxID=30023 RepID=UPI0007E61EE8|nr:structure-specific endonuclease subunit SLX4 isoform X1 [Drosophila elegans]